eukprot:g8332.t1
MATLAGGLRHTTRPTYRNARGYDGSSDPAAWLKHVELVLKYNTNLTSSDEEKISYAVLCMFGPAEYWAMRQSREGLTWVEFKRRLVEKFSISGLEDSALHAIANIQQHPNESVRSYSERYGQLCLEASIPSLDTYRVQWTMGLLPVLRRYVVFAGSNKFEEAVRIATRAELAEGGNRNRQQNLRYNSRAEPQSSNSAEPVCFHCGKPGHIKRDCPHLKSDSEPAKMLTRSPPIEEPNFELVENERRRLEHHFLQCFSIPAWALRSLGMKNCVSVAGKVVESLYPHESNPQSSPDTSHLLDTSPCVFVNGHPVHRVMFDSGCSRTILDARMINACHIGHVDRSSVGALELANGATVPPLGRTEHRYRVEFLQNGSSVGCFVYLTLFDSGDTYDLLLGQDFLKLMKTKTDFETDLYTCTEGTTIAQVLQLPKNVRVQSISNLTQTSNLILYQQPRVKIEPLGSDDEEERPFLCRMLQESERKQRIYEELNIGEGLNTEQAQQLSNLIETYDDVFAFELEDLHTPTNLVEHRIHLMENARPRHFRGHRRFSPAEKSFINSEVQRQLAAGVIVRSSSPWASPLTLVRKASGEFRMCVDYRYLNSWTMPDPYPLPHATEVLEDIAGAQYYSCLDGYSGYYTIPMAPNDVPKTQFVCHMGTFAYVRMPFGLTTAVATYCRYVSSAFEHLIGHGLRVYLDDVCVYGHSFEEHLAALEKAFIAARKSRFLLKPKKCFLFYREVAFLGHRVSMRGLAVQPDKIQEVIEFPPPRNVAEIRSFIGLASYYRRFVRNFAAHSEPLTKLTRKGVKFEWSDEQERGFKGLREALSSATWLKQPDFACDWQLECDASVAGVGAVLSQYDDVLACYRPVLFYSRMLSRAEKNYSVTELEALAVVAAFRHLRPYLLGRHVLVYTDHVALTNIFRKRTEIPPRIARWQVILSEFDYTLQYRKGKDNTAADFLSRNPMSRTQKPQVQNEGNSFGILDTIDPKETALVISSPPQQGPSNRADPQEEREVSSETDDSLELEPEDIENRAGVLPMKNGVTDPQYVDIVNYLKTGQLPPEPREKRKVMTQSKRFALEDDLLFYRDGDNQWKVVLHAEEVPKMLEEAHESETGGHFGRATTLQRARRLCYWRTMYRDVDQFVKRCQQCQKWGPMKTKCAPLTPFESVTPFEFLFMDWITPLPTSTRGNTSVIVAVEGLTRFVEARAFKNNTATSSRKFLRDIVLRYGPPLMIVTDQGRHFLGEFQHLCDQMHIQHRVSSAYHPQTIGAVERTNGLILGRLRRQLQQRAGVWDQYLSMAVLAINTRRTRRHSVSPMETLLGVTARSPLENSMIQQLLGESELVETVAAAARGEGQEDQHDRANLLQALRDECVQQQQLAATNMKGQYDKRIQKTQPIHVGDLVLVRRMDRQLGKLQKRWEGPHLVTWVGDMGAIGIEKEEGAATVSIDHVKPWYS